MAREAKVMSFPQDEMDEVVNLREAEGQKWEEIAETLGISSGKAILIYNFATLKPKDKIKDATPQKIKELREVDHLSWGVIMARTALSENAVRSMYEEATGGTSKGHRIGKGGRWPTGLKPELDEQSTNGNGAKKAPAKKASAAVPKNKPVPLKGLTAQEIKDKITGYAIKHNDETIAVKEVKKATASTIVVVDTDGKARTVKTAAVWAISKAPVVKS